MTIGDGSIAAPSVAEAVARAWDGLPDGARVAVASYLLAPGSFYDRIRASGADLVTAPRAPHPLLTEIVLDRYAAATARGYRTDRRRRRLRARRRG